MSVGIENVSVLSFEDQSTFRRLKEELEVALKELRERDAEEALNKITEEIELDGSDYIKAFFYSLRGQLRQITNRPKEAVSELRSRKGSAVSTLATKQDCFTRNLLRPGAVKNSNQPCQRIGSLERRRS